MKTTTFVSVRSVLARHLGDTALVLPAMVGATAMLLAALALPTHARAESELCNAPKSEWQPIANLESRLKDEGWKVRSIEEDEGCYEAYAVDPEGKRVEAYFNPKTLETVKIKKD